MLIAATKGLCVKFSVKGSAPNAGWHIDKAAASLESLQTKHPPIICQTETLPHMEGNMWRSAYKQSWYTVSVETSIFTVYTVHSNLDSNYCFNSPEYCFSWDPKTPKWIPACWNCYRDSSSQIKNDPLNLWQRNVLKLNYKSTDKRHFKQLKANQIQFCRSQKWITLLADIWYLIKLWYLQTNPPRYRCM